MRCSGDCLAAFPPRTRVAVEPRHESWWTPQIRRVLEERRCGPHLDRPSRPPAHAVVADGGLGLRTVPRGTGPALAEVRDRRAAIVGRPDHEGVRRRRGRFRVLQQRPERCRGVRRGRPGEGRATGRSDGEPYAAVTRRRGTLRADLSVAWRVARASGRMIALSEYLSCDSRALGKAFPRPERWFR